LCTLESMMSVMAPVKSDSARGDGAARDIEKECEIWDWVRAAGVSAEDLRKVLESQRASSGPRPA
jgi:hypothetical protein